MSFRLVFPVGAGLVLGRCWAGGLGVLELMLACHLHSSIDCMGDMDSRLWLLIEANRCLYDG